MTIFHRIFGKKAPVIETQVATAPVAVKESAAGPAIAAFTVGHPTWTPRNYAQLADEGYVKNVIVFRCINEIAKGAAGVPFILMNRGQEVENHALLKLLKKPNPKQGGAEFFEGFFAAHLIAGNAYIEANRGLSGKQPPRELWTQRPDRMRVVPASNGMIAAYEYLVNGHAVRWQADPISGLSNILHFKTYHPLNDWYGMSPLEAAAYSIDQHNEAAKWNKALLQNGARPSGALVWETAPLEDERKRLEMMLLDQYQGAENAGRPMVLGGKLDWKPMGLSPTDMDFLNAKLTSARDICRAFGVPPVLVVEGEGTYNNRNDARLELWEHTIIPLLDRALDALNNWLVPMFGDGLELKFDLDRVSALTPRRAQVRAAVIQEWQSGLITKNEGREALDYDTVNGGDEFATSQGVVSTPDTTRGTIELSDRRKLEKKDYVPTGVVSVTDELNDPAVIGQVSGLTKDLLASLVMKFGGDVVEEIGARVAFEQSLSVQKFIEEHTAELVQQINSTTKDALKVALGEGISAGEGIDDIASRIESVFDDASASRVFTIAQTESTVAAGFGANEAIQQSGISMKQWLATLDGHTRDTHAAMDGQVEPTDGMFRSPSGAEAEYPGGFGVPEEDINCRCAVTAALGEGKSKKNMGPEERKTLWEARETKRKAGEAQAVTVFRRVFDIQKAAVLKRLRHVAA